jgi:hypothetical protein
LVDRGDYETHGEDFLEMPDAKAADANAFQFAFFLGVANCAPAFLPGLRATQRTVDEIQVDVPKAAFVEGELDGLESVFVVGIDH